MNLLIVVIKFIHVIVLSEIWIYENENINFNLINYNAFFCNRNDSRSGGVVIYVHNSLNANKINSVCNDIIMNF